MLAAISDPARWQVEDAGGYFVVPAPETLVDLTAEERAALYRWLAQFGDNKIERWPLVFASPEVLTAQVREAGLSPAFLARVTQLAYPFAGGWALSDFSVLAAEYPVDDLRRWLVAVSATPSFVPRLHLERAGNLAEALAYWTLHDRNARIRPILLALLKTPSARGMEIAPLLPGAAALWAHDFNADHVRYDVTPMSFFVAVSIGDPAEPPDPNRPVSAWFSEAFAPVAGPRRFGDVLVLDPRGQGPLTFACTWIDENIVFARDPVGLGLWRFFTLAELQRRNPHFTHGIWATYRRREAATP